MLEEQKEGHQSWSREGMGEVSGGQIAQDLVNHNNSLGFHSNFSRKPLQGFEQGSHLIANVQGGPQWFLLLGIHTWNKTDR